VRPSEDYLINDIVQTGLLTTNDCGQINPQVQPGRLLYFVKREGWLNLEMSRTRLVRDGSWCSWTQHCEGEDLSHETHAGLKPRAG